MHLPLQLFLLSFSFCKPTEKPTGMAVYSLFRGMIKRIAFVRCGRKLTVFKRVPRLNVNKAIMLLILNFLYQNGLFLLNHNQNEKVVELLLKYMVFFDLCN
ncbi:hypothetical protein BHL85_12210 [Limosilactobacillus reuteri]|nr:hypothetical protein BHL85_12210 [Limosilactobacillus reuteri]